MTKATANKLINAAKDAVASAQCEHDADQEHDPRAPFGFETWRCKKCGTKFHVPKYEAV
jgi:ribosomal protein L37AE/L43A